MATWLGYGPYPWGDVNHVEYLRPGIFRFRAEDWIEWGMYLKGTDGEHVILQKHHQALAMDIIPEKHREKISRMMELAIAEVERDVRARVIMLERQLHAAKDNYESIEESLDMLERLFSK